jgi:tRNA threonylcarbamoyladenosine dehydratase
VYSDEQVIPPVKNTSQTGALQANIHTTAGETCVAEDIAITGLNCAGYGSSVCVTAPFGFMAAGLVLDFIIKNSR